MKSKKAIRIRRSTRTRKKIRELGAERLCIHRTPRHMYAQIISADGSKTLASASTLDSDVKSVIKNSGNADAATAVGKIIAEKSKDAGVTTVAFDRSGFKYHGRVKALAESARENGLEF
ncbi:LSU ribosomal protein L18p (L5e) [hydrothermal vent metagenome]|uniref:LSU ribosomal protein L18p (L5e) n=1 Tax=hydrothermal vent metagenome TaxID=652676 RepID=A0A3B0WYC6_9ZZZZ